MEPKMLEFPNPYCRDRDQGDLDDLIFAVGGPAGPSDDALTGKTGRAILSGKSYTFPTFAF